MSDSTDAAVSRDLVQSRALDGAVAAVADLRRGLDALSEAALELRRAVGGLAALSGVERFTLAMVSVERITVEGAVARLDLDVLEPERIDLEAA